MSSSRWSVWMLALAVGASAAAGLRAAEASPLAMPPFSQVYSLVRSNLAGVSEADLNRAAVVGFLNELHGQVSLVNEGTTPPANSSAPLVSKTAIYDGAFALLRVGRVGPGLSNELVQAYAKLRATNELKGIVMDLRYASGEDYRAAAEAADLFVSGSQPLLRLDGTVLHSAPNSNELGALPVVVLINHDTSGAPEALAAALREADGSPIIGSASAGHADLYKEIPLGGGRALRIASGEVASGNGLPLPKTGIEPDIPIVVSPERARAYFADPYYKSAAALAQASTASLDNSGFAQSTNQPRRRVNEADLVRQQKEGIDLETELATAGPGRESGPVMTDPALSRALDLLKGLAVALKRR